MASFRSGPGISTPHGGGKLHRRGAHVVLVQHIVGRCIGCTRTHTPASAGAAKGHQAQFRGAEDVVHNYSRCGHHVQHRHHMVDIGSNGKVFLQRGSREKMLADGEAFPTPGSRLHPWFSVCIATWWRLATDAEGRKRPSCLWSQLDVALDRHHCLLEVSSPTLWRSARTLPRVQWVVQRVNSLRQRSHRSTMRSIHCGGSRHRSFFFFLLQCRIAQDSCGHVPANSRSKRSRQLLPCSTKQNENKPQPKQTNNTQTRGVAAASVTWNVS